MAKSRFSWTISQLPHRITPFLGAGTHFWGEFCAVECWVEA